MYNNVCNYFLLITDSRIIMQDKSISHLNIFPTFLCILKATKELTHRNGSNGVGPGMIIVELD